MYGLQGKMIAKPGRRDALLALLLEGSRGAPMPGCRLYVVSEVPSEPEAIAITEVWDDKAPTTRRRSSSASVRSSRRPARSLPGWAGRSSYARSAVRGWTDAIA